MPEIEIREYVDARGRRAFSRWFDRLNATAAARVTVTLARLEQGNLSNVKSVGAGVQECRIDFGPGYRIYFGRDGDTLIILLCGGTKTKTTARHRRRECALARIPAAEAERELAMGLTQEFKSTVRARVQRDPAFREALLRDGVECLIGGDVETGKAVLRDYINATLGFEGLAALTDKSPKSLMRMFGPKGNPQARNLFEVIGCLQAREGVRLEVRAVR